MLYTFFTVLSIATASKTPQSQANENTTSVGGNALAEEIEGDAKASSPDQEKDMVFPVTLPTIIFQVIMLITSLYFGMLFSNWGDAVISGNTSEQFTSATYSMWIKIASLWITLALFTVSVTLTICCPNRLL